MCRREPGGSITASFGNEVRARGSRECFKELSVMVWNRIKQILWFRHMQESSLALRHKSDPTQTLSLLVYISLHLITTSWRLSGVLTRGHGHTQAYMYTVRYPHPLAARVDQRERDSCPGWMCASRFVRDRTHAFRLAGWGCLEGEVYCKCDHSTLLHD